jgi:biopolymer transport protein ExbB
MAMKRFGIALSLIGVPSAAFAEIDLVGQVRDGGAVVLVTLGLSILFLAVTFERLRNLRARTVRPETLLPTVQSLWAGGRFAEIQEVLADDGNDSTLAKVIATVVEHRDQRHEIVSALAGDVASMDLRRHQQKAYPLAIVATVAPIVGLLGTVLGMVESFHVIAYSEGMGNPALLAGGISKALVNTAAGLIVALPALGMHHFFKYRLATLGLGLEQDIDALIKKHFLAPEACVPREAAHAH